MKLMSILLTIFHGIWAMQPEAVKAYQPLIDALIANPSYDITHMMPKAKVFDINAIVGSPAPLASPNSWNGGLANAPKGSVAILPMSGVVMKKDNCGAPGTQTVGSWLSQVDANPHIIGAVFVADTPGGSVDGTPILADQIKGMQKPIVGLVDGMCCSAGEWMISATDYIYASHPLNQVGSIGIMSSFMDTTKQDKKAGVKRVQVYATNSTDKNKDFADALAGDTTAIVARLDAMNAMFAASIKKNRWNKGLSKEVFTGKTYLAQDAIGLGLIDAIGTMPAAINKVLQLSKS
ncbi:MAG: hypothetical protein JWO03_926 [Bacteroidetes bacterium]|nr:hypothetical protein [Bacteroidota bacterium]